MRAVDKAARRWIGSTDGTQGRGLLLNEWEKEGWTYHAKGLLYLFFKKLAIDLIFCPGHFSGIWLSPDSESPPVMTLFGSTNLNSRSAHIDTELSFLLIIPPDELQEQSHDHTTKSPPKNRASIISLQEDLAREVQHIRSNATEWKGDKRHVRLTTKMIVAALKGML